MTRAYSVPLAVLVHVCVAWTISDFARIARVAHRGTFFVFWPFTYILSTALALLSYLLLFSVLYGAYSVVADRHAMAITDHTVYGAQFVTVALRIYRATKPWYYRAWHYVSRGHHLLTMRFTPLEPERLPEEKKLWRTTASGEAPDPRNFCDDTEVITNGVLKPPSAYLVHLEEVMVIKRDNDAAQIVLHVTPGPYGSAVLCFREYQRWLVTGDPAKQSGMIVFRYGSDGDLYCFPVKANATTTLLPPYTTKQMQQHARGFAVKHEFEATLYLFTGNDDTPVATFTGEKVNRAVRMWAGPFGDFYEGEEGVDRSVNTFAHWFLQMEGISTIVKDDRPVPFRAMLTSVHPDTRGGGQKLVTEASFPTDFLWPPTHDDL